MRAERGFRRLSLLAAVVLATGGCTGGPLGGAAPAGSPGAAGMFGAESFGTGGAAPPPAVRAAVAQLSVQPAAGPDIITTGDVLEVSFFAVDAVQEVESYLVQIGDVLRVDVADHLELSRDDVLVLPDGTVSLPLLGTIRATGRTVESLSQTVRQRYSAREILTPSVTIAVARTRATEPAGLSGGTNVIRVPVFKGQAIELPFVRPIPVDRPLEQIRADIQQAYRQQFGSTVRVTVNLAERRERDERAFVMGAVNAPGPVPLEPNMTALMAIAAAGGVTEAANVNRIYLVRLRADGGYDYIPLGLATTPGMGDSGASAVTLSENDVIVVEPKRTLGIL